MGGKQSGRWAAADSNSRDEESASWEDGGVGGQSESFPLVWPTSDSRLTQTDSLTGTDASSPRG